MTLKALDTKGMKGLRGSLLLFLMILIPLALGSFGKKAEASSSHGAPAHEVASEHGGGHEVAPAHGGGHETVASESTDHGTPTHGEEAAHSDSGHGEEVVNGGGHHHAKPPILYYVYWSILFFGVLMSGFYIIRVVKVGKPHHEAIFLAFIFVCMACFLFISANYVPSMARHFDMPTLTFVDGYHEAPLIGFVKFIYRVIFGAFLTVYAIFGMEHH